MNTNPKISIIIPAYNEEESLPYLYERLNTLMNNLNQYEFANVVEEVNGFKECGTSLFYQYLINNFNNYTASTLQIL